MATVCVHVVFGTTPGNEPFFFTAGKLYEGYGPYQREVKLDFNTTLGALREQWGDPSIGEGLPAETPAATWGNENEDEAGLVIAQV